MEVSTKLKYSLKSAVSIMLLGLILYNIDWTRIEEVIKTVNLSIFALTILFNIIGVSISVLKWKWLLNIYNIEQTFYRLHSLYYVGFLFNNFLPSMVGGDIVRIINTVKNGRYADATSAVLSERITGLVVMVFLAGIAALWNLYRDVPIGVTWLALAFITTSVLMLGVAGVYLLLEKRQGQVSLMRWLKPVHRLVTALVETLRYPNIVIRAILISAIFHILLVANGYLFAKSIGLDLDILVLAVVFPVAMLVAMLPISVNGLGLKEGSLIILLGQMGVTIEQALIIAILSRIFIILGSIIGGILFVQDKDIIFVRSLLKKGM